MTYISWATAYEGATDRAYYEVLLPRILTDISLREGTRSVQIPESAAVQLSLSGRAVEEVAGEICKNAQAFHIAFIHADIGGRGVRQSLAQRSQSYCDRANELCAWPQERCVTITPNRETEAWVLADVEAVLDALGYAGSATELGLSATAAAAEALPDPKSVLENAVRLATPRRRRSAPSQIFSAVAQAQSLDRLRGAESFRLFETRVRGALASLGVMASA